MTGTHGCCSRPSAAQCRCYTDAAAITQALRVYIRRRVRHPQDAEDITQDALLRLYRAAPTLHDDLALEAWMYQIARSAIVDHHRRAAARPQPADLDSTSPEPAADEPDEPTAIESLAGCVATLLDRVPEHYRRALELTDLGGLTQERAATELGLTTSGMKSRVQRGRRLLREEITRCCLIALDSHGTPADVELREPGAC
jgi:RNA polymerase sigma-70 factor, ECF subfamily